MGKKKHRDHGSGTGDQNVEKQITGSGADVVSHEDEQGRVKCKCIVPCVWRGYRDEGDTVWIEKELIEKDAFVRMHFEEVKSEELRVNSSDNAEGADGNGNGGSDNANGQGELDLK